MTRASSIRGDSVDGEEVVETVSPRSGKMIYDRSNSGRFMCRIMILMFAGVKPEGSPDVSCEEMLVELLVGQLGDHRRSSLRNATNMKVVIHPDVVSGVKVGVTCHVSQLRQSPRRHRH